MVVSEMAKDVTLSDIAEAVGVSSVAVHKALNDKPGVSEELRKKIKQTAMEMGYINTAVVKQAPDKLKTGNIGVIIPEQYYGYSTSFYGLLYEQVVKALYKSRYYGILELLSSEDTRNIRLPKVVQDKKVDGLIFLGQTSREYADFMIRQAKIPLIFLDSYLPMLTIDTIISDGFYGTYMLTNYLIKCGHRKIGFAGSVDATSSIADRYWGYRKALRENQIAFQRDWEIPDRDEWGKTSETIVTGTAGLDAFVCNCDTTAYTLIQNLEARGFHVPEDISVVGFDNFLPPGIDSEFITSYRVETEVMAKRCVKTLLKKIRGEQYAKGIQVVTGEIVYKKSVAERPKIQI